MTVWNDEDKSVDFSMWYYGKFNWPMTFWEKLRWCWHILRKGKPYTDCLVLDYPTAEELAKDILKGIEGTK